jgi:hypothetical protein
MKYTYLIIIILLLVTGCTTNQNSTGLQDKQLPNNPAITSTEKADEKIDTSSTQSIISNIISPEYNGKILAGDKAPYIEFNTKDYEKASKNGKVILLYFYSDYSYISKTEEIKIIKAFNDMTNNQMIGFKLHFEDINTTQEEKQIASLYEIKESRTKLILKNGKVMQKNSATWDIGTYATQMSLYLD